MSEEKTFWEKWPLGRRVAVALFPFMIGCFWFTFFRHHMLGHVGGVLFSACAIAAWVGLIRDWRRLPH